MAKKNENQLSYLQMPLPEGRKSYRLAKRAWNGLNKRQTIDTGALSMTANMSTSEAPYLTPAQKWTRIKPYTTYPISAFGFDDFLVVVHKDGSRIKIDYLSFKDCDEDEPVTYTSVLASGSTDTSPRSIIQFNVYDTPTDTLTGKYVQKLLIYPDCKSMDFEITDDDFEIMDLNAEVVVYSNSEEPYLPPADADKDKYYKNTFNQDVYRWVEDEEDESKSAWKASVPPGGPKLKYAAVHASRVFGVDTDRVYASGYNDYTNWSLDTVDAYNESNAWCSPAQANTKAGGEFTGIVNFQGHVVCFKRDFMHEIYNTKNPFRIQDIFAEGAIDQRTIQDVDGRLIFVSEDNVKVYTGSNPRIIGHNLNIRQFEKAVSGTDNRNYYLYCKEMYGGEHLFVYDTITEQWSELTPGTEVRAFAHNRYGMFALCEDGLYRIDTGSYDQDWSFETDLITNQTANIKHIKKLQMLIDLPETINNEDNDARIKVYALYDGEEFSSRSQLVYDSAGRTGQLAVRVKPRKTAGYGIKLHVEGHGYAKLYELELFMENGGDLYV